MIVQLITVLNLNTFTKTRLYIVETIDKNLFTVNIFNGSKSEHRSVLQAILHTIQNTHKIKKFIKNSSDGINIFLFFLPLENFIL